MFRVLIASSIRQKKAILCEFLSGVEELQSDEVDISFLFVDDNVEKGSSELLDVFALNHQNTTIKKAKDLCVNEGAYACDSNTHYWSLSAIERITLFKNYIIKFACEKAFDYLFLIDSDIVIDKRCLKHLLNRHVDIVSNVFWTQWKPGEDLVHQAFWIPNISYVTFNNGRINPNGIDADQAKIDFSLQMRFPGIYEVDGLGACTLISQNALRKGVSFQKVPNLSVYGEDRDFCIRAGCLGFKLYLDTVYPAYHIYREEYLDRVEEFKKDGWKFDMCRTCYQCTNNHTLLYRIARFPYEIAVTMIKYIKSRVEGFKAERQAVKYYHQRDNENNKVVLSMIVRKGSEKNLKQVFDSIKQVVDHYVIIGDNNTDKEISICETLLNGLSYKVITNAQIDNKSGFKLRRFAWNETVKSNPGWIFGIDSNEFFPNDCSDYIHMLINQKDIDLCYFLLDDIQNNDTHKDGNIGKTDNTDVPFLIRYNPNFRYKWKKTNRRTPRIPSFIKKANVDLK